MTREAGFYLMVPGLSTYLILVGLLYYIPVQQSLHHQLSVETAVFYFFLTMIFYPIALLLILFGNKALQVFRMSLFSAVSLIPILAAFVILSVR
jgi:hypothetical protein